MNISIDSDGNVHLDTAYNTTGIDTISTKMNSVLNMLKTFDPAQIDAMTTKLNSIYPTITNFNQFMDEWFDVLHEVEI